MKIIISTSVMELPNGTFLPHFQLTELEGGETHDISYTLEEKSACPTKEEALKHAGVHGVREVKKLYGEDTEVLIRVKN